MGTSLVTLEGTCAPGEELVQEQSHAVMRVMAYCQVLCGSMRSGHAEGKPACMGAWASHGLCMACSVLQVLVAGELEWACLHEKGAVRASGSGPCSCSAAGIGREQVV